MNTAIWNSILQQIQRVPSPENTQPWSFRLAFDRLEVFWLPAVAHHFFDTKDHAACLSIGGLFEYLDIAASDIGMQVQAEQIEPSFDGQIPAMVLSLRPSTANRSELFSALSLRQTNRTIFEKIEITAPIQNIVTSLKMQFPHLQFSFVQHLNEPFLEVLSQLESEFWSYPEYIRDLLTNICFQEKEWQERQAGIFYKELGLAPQELLPLALAKKMPWLQGVLPHLGTKLFVQWHNQALLNSSQLLIIGAKNPSQESLIDVGRAGMRAWLHFTEHELAVHPMTALALQVYELNAGLLPPFIQGEHKALLSEASKLYLQELRMPFPAWALRIGKPQAKYKSCPSLRKKIVLDEPSYSARLVKNASLEMSFPPNPANTGVTI